MCAYRLRLAVVVALVSAPQPPALRGQDTVERNDWELTLGTAVGIADGAAFTSSSTIAVATGSIAYRLTERFLLRGGLSFAAVDQIGTLLGASASDLALPLPGLGDTDYWSVSVGPAYCKRIDTSRVAPYVSARLAFVRDTSGDKQTGLGVGGSTGVRARLIGTVGLELGIDASWARLYRSYQRIWQSGATMMLNAGIVFGL